MIKVAILDDYQNIFKEFVDVKKYKTKYDFQVFTEFDFVFIRGESR